MKEEKIITVPGWQVIGKTVRGSSHVRSDLPNQDALKLPASDMHTGLILALADGHGSSKYFRSDVGAQTAVSVAHEILASADPAHLSMTKRWAEDQLPKQLVYRWREEVKRHYEAHPFTTREQERLVRKDGKAAWETVQADPVQTYGATLLAVLVTETFILYVQLGDGDILKVSERGEVSRALPGDTRLFANETTSLCSRNAWADFRIHFEVLPVPQAAPALIMLSTDGYSNSFQHEKGFLAVGSDLLAMIREEGLDEVEAQLEGWLNDASEHGSGDDITLGLLCRSNATRQTLRVSQKAGPFFSLREALQKARPQASILVEPGIYREQCVIEKPLQIIGQGPQENIIIESVGSPCISMQADQAEVRGLTLKSHTGSADHYQLVGTVDILKGQLLLQDCDISAAAPACVHIVGSAAEAVIRGCRIHDGQGFGILADGARGSVEQCDIFGNAGPGLEMRQSSMIVRDCRIHDGLASGVNILAGSQARVEDCDIFANTAPGVMIADMSNPIILSCRIHDGKSGGVFVHRNGLGHLENCEIAGNQAYGVGSSQQSNLRLQGCKIHHGEQRGVVVWGKSGGKITGSEIYDNSWAGIEIREESILLIEDTKIYGGREAGIRITEGGQVEIKRSSIFENGNNGIVAWGKSRGSIGEKTEIYANVGAGVEIREQSVLALNECSLHSNRGPAIALYERGDVSLDDCQCASNSGGVFSGDYSVLLYRLKTFISWLRKRPSRKALPASARQLQSSPMNGKEHESLEGQ
jgi:hypothetical protein